MRVLWLEPDHGWLERRRREGLDRFDEVWEGILHVVPQPSSDHQRFERGLERVIEPIAEKQGLEVFHQLGLYDPDPETNNYRVPDLTVVRPEHVSKRGADGRAELVIEVLSPNDESREKLPFFARCRIPEVWLVDPATREVEVYVLIDNAYRIALPNRHRIIEAPRLGLELQVIDGPKLRIGWADGSAEI